MMTSRTSPAAPRRFGATLIEVTLALTLTVVFLAAVIEWGRTDARQGRERAAAQDLSRLADLVEAHVLREWTLVTSMTGTIAELDWASMASSDAAIPATAPSIPLHPTVSAWLVADSGLWLVLVTEDPPSDTPPRSPPSTPSIRQIGSVNAARPGVATGRGFEVGIDGIEAALDGEGSLTGAMVAVRALDRPGPLSPYLHAADQTGGEDGHPRAELHRMETDLAMREAPVTSVNRCAMINRWNPATTPTTCIDTTVDPGSQRGYHVFGVGDIEVGDVELAGTLDAGGAVTIGGNVVSEGGWADFATTEARGVVTRELRLPDPQPIDSLTVVELSVGGSLETPTVDTFGNLSVTGTATLNGKRGRPDISSATMVAMSSGIETRRYVGNSVITSWRATVEGDLITGGEMLVNHCDGPSCP